MAYGLVPLLNEMENRKEIQKAQKVPKPKKTIVGGTMVAAEKVVFFLVFLGKKLIFQEKTTFP